MSALFFRLSWPANVARYRQLQADAKKQGFRLTVKNANTRFIPVFLFYLDRRDGKLATSFHDLDDVAKALANGSAS